MYILMSMFRIKQKSSSVKIDILKMVKQIYHARTNEIVKLYMVINDNINVLLLII